MASKLCYFFDFFFFCETTKGREEDQDRRRRRKNGNKFQWVLVAIKNRRSEYEELSAIATPGHLLALWKITGSYQITGPTGRVVRLRRGVRETVPFLARARDGGRKGGGHVFRCGFEVEMDKAGWNPGFDGGTFSPSLSGNVWLVMRTRSIIGLVLNRGRGGVTALLLVGQLR